MADNILSPAVAKDVLYSSGYVSSGVSKNILRSALKGADALYPKGLIDTKVSQPVLRPALLSGDRLYPAGIGKNAPTAGFICGFNGKIRIKDSLAVFLDGKTQVRDVTTAVFAGKTQVRDVATAFGDGKVDVQALKHTDFNAVLRGKIRLDENLDSGISGASVLQAKSGLTGQETGVTSPIFSGLKGVKTEGLSASSALESLAELNVGSGLSGLAKTEIYSAIIGGEADVFGFSYPLADKIPLRNTTVWGSFEDVRTIPHVYGRVRLSPIPYDKSKKFFVIADHSIQGVDKVWIDDVEAQSWKFKNTLDSSNSPVAMLELGDSLPQGSTLIVLIRGKVHPVTGQLLTNPADVIWDILANIVGAPVDFVDFDRFRIECALYGIEVGGVLDNRERTVKKQLDIIVESIGAIWSGGMPGLVRIYPVKE